MNTSNALDDLFLVVAFMAVFSGGLLVSLLIYWVTVWIRDRVTSKLKARR